MCLSKVGLRANIWSILVVLGLLTRLSVSGRVNGHVMEFRKFYIKTIGTRYMAVLAQIAFALGGRDVPLWLSIKSDFTQNLLVGR